MDLAPHHPRLLLDDATLTRMRAEVANNTALWKAFSDFFDDYFGGKSNPVDGNDYPDKPDVGEGYQGAAYYAMLLGCALGYQVLRTSDPARAAQFGAEAVDTLMAMAGASSAINRDSNYGVRFFGAGLGIGYDWLYDLLTPEQRTTVYEAGNAWVEGFETESFEFAHPQSNYFAGYFHAKAAVALATYEDNPKAPAMWADWRNNQYATRVQPYYAEHMTGGGWPEGFGYGDFATWNMTAPLLEVLTATGENLAPAYTWPLDQAAYVMHFIWPDRTVIDDRDCLHTGGANPAQVDTGMLYQLLATLDKYGSPLEPVMRQYLQEVEQATGRDPARMSSASENMNYEALLFVNREVDTAPVGALPRHYHADGLNAVAARSDWTTEATWLSFRAGPYVNYSGQGEELHDQGSLAIVRGGTPLLVNTWGWCVRAPAGNYENDLYDDEYGNTDAKPTSIYRGNRQCYNVFYARSLDASGNPEQAFGQESVSAAATRTVSQDFGSYVYIKATAIEDMYRGNKALVKAWQREVVFLRPCVVVVFDRTEMGANATDQYLAWHFPAQPHDRRDGWYGTDVGAMWTPDDVALKTLPVYPTSNPPKAWQVQVRPAASSAQQTWMTVFCTADTLPAITLIDDHTVQVGDQTVSFGDDGVAVNGDAPPADDPPEQDPPTEDPPSDDPPAEDPPPTSPPPKISNTQKGMYQVSGGTAHATEREAVEEATNLGLASPGSTITITPPDRWEIVVKVPKA